MVQSGLVLSTIPHMARISNMILFGVVFVLISCMLIINIHLENIIVKWSLAFQIQWGSRIISWNLNWIPSLITGKIIFFESHKKTFILGKMK